MNRKNVLRFPIFENMFALILLFDWINIYLQQLQRLPEMKYSFRILVSQSIQLSFPVRALNDIHNIFFLIFETPFSFLFKEKKGRKAFPLLFVKKKLW